MKRQFSVLLAAVFAASLAGCTAVSTVSDSTVSSAASSQTEAEVVTVTFTDSGITADGSGCTVDGTVLTIDTAGTYLLTGSCADGSVKVKKGTTGVTLILSGLNLTSASTAPIVCGRSSVVTIEAADGTDNTLTDASCNNDETNPENADAENAVIKCKDGAQVTLCGTGSLTVQANGKNGIKSGTADTENNDQAASLTIRDLTLTVNAAVNDAVNAEQLLYVESGTLLLDAADDALHCDLEMNIGAQDSDGPAITITNAYEGIEAATLNIASGDVNITCTDDCLNAGNADLTGYDFSIAISGGHIVAYTSAGDGFDSNGDITISGGNIEVWTANTADNQPLDADGTVTLSGGTVLAAGGSSGMGLTLNAAQTSVIFGGSSMGGEFAMGRNAGTQQDNQPPALPDGESFDGSFQPGEKPAQDGEMPARPDDNGAQQQNGSTPPELPAGGNAAGPNAAGAITAGSTFTITDADGNSVYTGTARCNAGYVVFSDAALADGSSYTLTSGSNTLQADAAAGTSSTGREGGRGAAPADTTDAAAPDNKQTQPQ